MPDTTRHAVMDEDRRHEDKGERARMRDRLDDDIAEQGRQGNRDMPFKDDDDERMSER